MNCPRLPTLPSSTVSRIDPSWFRDLQECLKYAMSHPFGDGRTILNEAGGSLRVIAGTTGDGGGNSAQPYTGSFPVTLTDSEGKGTPVLRIGRGYVNVNGVFFALEERELAPQAGFLCVSGSIDSGENGIETPELAFAQPDATHYPIAEITGDGDNGFTVRQFPVTVAVILITRTCIFAKAAAT